MDPAAIKPDKKTILQNMGMQENHVVSPKIESVLAQAFEEYMTSAKPVGVYEEISENDFSNLFDGEGNNDESAPLRTIFQRSEKLALFAVTIGENIVERIEKATAENNFALTYMLDAVASQAADNASGSMEDIYGKTFFEKDPGSSAIILGYSPGYCGWDISGQKKLFEMLDPGRLGITLNKNYLMNPLKSVTGVLVAGQPEIHEFLPKFGFCKVCRTRSCIDRMKSIRKIANGAS